MRQVGRICYGIAVALGLLSVGVEWQERRKQGKARSLFPQPLSHTGMLVALWAGIVGLMGKVVEDAGQRQPITAGTTGPQGSTRFGPYRTYLPNALQRTKSLRSDFDLGDQYVDPRSNAQPLTVAH